MTNTNVENRAYMMTSKTEVGVTDNVNDLSGKLLKLKPGESVRIEAGYKEDLLEKEKTVLWIDAVINSYGEDKIVVPIEPKDCNLVPRNLNEQKLRKFYSYIEAEQSFDPDAQNGIFSGLIDGENSSN